MALVKRNVTWPVLHEDVMNYLARCKTCAVAKKEGVSAKTTLGIEASTPWDALAIDFTILEPAKDEKENVLIVTDVFRKFAWAFPTWNQRGSTMARNLVERIFNRFGCPGRVHSDQVLN